jgi:UrcA family protein
MTTNTIKSVLTAALALASMAFATTTVAAPAGFEADTVSVKIPLSGIDLHTRAGAGVVLNRIRQASRAICGEEPDGRDLHSRAIWVACVKETADRAVTSLNSPLVTALNGGAAPAMLASKGN